VESNNHPGSRGSATQRQGEERRRMPIRFHDLIPKRDVKGGQTTLFGSVRARPEKQQKSRHNHENENITQDEN
jgi:hypothetical protein